MRRKRLSLANRRRKELRSVAGAPLRRFLVTCRSRNHFSTWHLIKRRARADRRNELRRSKKAGHETRNMWRAFGRPLAALLSPSSIARRRYDHMLAWGLGLEVLLYIRATWQGGRIIVDARLRGFPVDRTSASGRGANAGFWRPGSMLTALHGRAAETLAPCRRDESAAPRLAAATPPAFVFLHGPRSPISSTALRGSPLARKTY